jgi:hypothetical protein
MLECDELLLRFAFNSNLRRYSEELQGVRLSPKAANEVLDKRFRDGKGSDGRVTVLVGWCKLNPASKAPGCSA